MNSQLAAIFLVISTLFLAFMLFRGLRAVSCVVVSLCCVLVHVCCAPVVLIV
jgi:hypothetical protein